MTSRLGVVITIVYDIPYWRTVFKYKRLHTIFKYIRKNNRNEQTYYVYGSIFGFSVNHLQPVFLGYYPTGSLLHISLG